MQHAHLHFGHRRMYHFPHAHELLGAIARFIRKNVVLCVALTAALLSMVAVPPDAEYLSYFDLKTLTCLFCVLAVVCALKNINFFYILACEIVRRFNNLRAAVLALVYVTFIGSMFIANDMALLTFLPLGFFVLSTTGNKRYMAFTFIMQNIAANLGGMLTPFGNPQNLYLYTAFSIPTGEFMMIMLLPFALSVTLITVCCLVFIKKIPLSVGEGDRTLDKKKCIIYGILFALAIAIVFRGIPYWIGLIIIPIVLIFMDRKALAQVDYPLLLTFAAFFVFSGNVSRIEVVRNVFEALLSKSTLLFSTLSCQIISNVPSAILLSGFTDNYPQLLVGVNIGGTGTIIASLASLITFKEYVKHDPHGVKSYMIKFSAFNFGFLAILLTVMLFVMA